MNVWRSIRLIMVKKVVKDEEEKEEEDEGIEGKEEGEVKKRESVCVRKDGGSKKEARGKNQRGTKNKNEEEEKRPKGRLCSLPLPCGMNGGNGGA